MWDWCSMDHLPFGIGGGGAGGDAGIGNEAAGLTHEQRELVEARIVQSLGSAAGGMFEIVPAGRMAPGVYSAALLLAGHLPVIISVDESQAGCVYYIHLYDVYGRRVHTDGAHSEPLARHHQLSEAMVAAELGFRLLQHHSRSSHAQRFYGERVGRLPEEQWLHEQLCGQEHPRPAA